MHSMSTVTCDPAMPASRSSTTPAPPGRSPRLCLADLVAQPQLDRGFRRLDPADQRTQVGFLGREPPAAERAQLACVVAIETRMICTHRRAADLAAAASTPAPPRPASRSPPPRGRPRVVDVASLRDARRRPRPGEPPPGPAFDRHRAPGMAGLPAPPAGGQSGSPRADQHRRRSIGTFAGSISQISLDGRRDEESASRTAARRPTVRRGPCRSSRPARAGRTTRTRR